MTLRQRLVDSPRWAGLSSRLSNGLFARGALWFIIATTAVNLSNFLFHIVISRLLGPAHYGVVGALITILNLLVVPIGAVQLAVTQAFVEATTGTRRLSLAKVTRRGLLGGSIAGLLFIALTPALEGFLHLRSPIPLFWADAWIPLATVSAVLQGALIGEYRFRPVAFATFVGGGPVRLLLGVGAAMAGLGVSGAIMATTAAQAFTVTSLLYSARNDLRNHESNPSLRTTTRDMVMSIAALASYTTLGLIDTFLARHLFRPTAAGNYAAGAVVAHIALFAPAAIVAAAFPHLADGQGVTDSSRRAFTQALKITTLLGLVVAGTLTVFSGLTVRLLFGARYAGATSVVGMLAFASAALGVVSVFVFFHLARRSLLAQSPWLGVVVAVGLIFTHHRSTSAVAAIILVVSLLTLVVAGVPALGTLTSRRRTEDRDG